MERKTLNKKSLNVRKCVAVRGCVVSGVMSDTGCCFRLITIVVMWKMEWFSNTRRVQQTIEELINFVSLNKCKKLNGNPDGKR